MGNVFEKHDLFKGFPTLLPRHARFRQERDLLCGAASLQSVLAKHDITIDQATIVELGGMAAQGMVFAGLKRATQQLGLHAYGKRYDNLTQLRGDLVAGYTPILQFTIPSERLHYGVACGYVEDRFIVHDPSCEQYVGGVLPWKVFARRFFRKEPDGTIVGYGLIVTREEQFFA